MVKSRLQVDAEWLARLRKDGLAAHLSQLPETSSGLASAVQQINEGRYWQAHETLEAVWLPARYPLRLFYYALIKLAVGLLHMERGNAGGARQQLRAAVDYLGPFCPRFHGLRTDLLLEDATACLQMADGGSEAQSGPLRIRWEEHAST